MPVISSSSPPAHIQFYSCFSSPWSPNNSLNKSAISNFFTDPFSLFLLHPDIPLNLGYSEQGRRIPTLKTSTKGHCFVFKTLCFSPSFLLNLKYPAIIKYPFLKGGNCPHRTGEAKAGWESRALPQPCAGNHSLAPAPASPGRFPAGS